MGKGQCIRALSPDFSTKEGLLVLCAGVVFTCSELGGDTCAVVVDV